MRVLRENHESTLREPRENFVRNLCIIKLGYNQFIVQLFFVGHRIGFALDIQGCFVLF